MQLSNDTFKKIIILFWTFWWVIAFWTDIVGTLTHMGYLHATWAPDTNYPFLVSSLKMYDTPEWLNIILFIGILIWSLVAALVFCYASVSLNKSRAIWMHRAQIAFIVTISYWLAFFLADQMVMKFDLEENHMVQGGFEFLTYLGLYLLP